MNSQDRLISVESQTEHSPIEGKSETRIFLKMYTSAVREGLIADMGDSNWRTLCVIASFMDVNGKCYPTQSQIAKGLGVSRQAANGRISRLVKYRWRGLPLVTSLKSRTKDGKWDNTRYTIMPISQLRIFDADPANL